MLVKALTIEDDLTFKSFATYNDISVDSSTRRNKFIKHRQVFQQLTTFI